MALHQGNNVTIDEVDFRLVVHQSPLDEGTADDLQAGAGQDGADK